MEKKEKYFQFDFYCLFALKFFTIKFFFFLKKKVVLVERNVLQSGLKTIFLSLLGFSYNTPLIVKYHVVLLRKLGKLLFKPFPLSSANILLNASYYCIAKPVCKA